ncbi:MAG TPA: metallophosphoesterase family protein, partial [Bacilli bacterium]|nr:metallophosphoesterase family protein [Bacilli bacterium]
MKKIFKLFLLAGLIITSFLFVLSPLVVNAATREAYQIITNPGENMASEVNINWHSDIEGTFVEYTLKTDSDYSNAIRVVGSVEALDFNVPNDSTWTVYDFSKRNICRATLSNLLPDTEYKYRVGKTVFSKDYFFKTAGSGSFTFINMSDPQFYGDASAQVWYNLMADAFVINKNISFALLNGDVVNQGNEGSYWDLFFDNHEVSQIMVAAATGNHEYYAGSTTTVDARFYNAHFNNPDNGASNLLNSSYYFIYNNALFVVIDSQKTEGGTWATQKVWFEEVVRANPTQYIIVSSHISIYGAANGDNSVALRREWTPLFDKYGVDLVLTGHDHIYARSKIIYNGEETSDRFKGTCYVIGGVAGNGTKYTADKLDKEKMDKWYELKTSYGIVTVSSGTISYRCYDMNQNVIDTFILPAKRTSNADQDFDKNIFLQELAIVANDNDRTTARFNWPKEAYGHVDTITLKDDKDNQLDSKFIFMDNENYFDISGLTLDATYKYKAVINFRDGSKSEQQISFKTTINYGDVKITTNNLTSQGLELGFNINVRSDLLNEVGLYVN